MVALSVSMDVPSWLGAEALTHLSVLMKLFCEKLQGCVAHFYFLCHPSLFVAQGGVLFTCAH